MYTKVWRKSNALYLTTVVAGCVVFGGVYGAVMDKIWDLNNKGVRFGYVEIDTKFCNFIFLK